MNSQRPAIVVRPGSGDGVLSLGLAEAMATRTRRRAELALLLRSTRFAQGSSNVLDSRLCDTPRLASNRLGILIPIANSFRFLCGPGMSVPPTRTQGSFGSAPQAGHLNARGAFMRSILRPGRKDAI